MVNRASTVVSLRALAFAGRRRAAAPMFMDAAQIAIVSDFLRVA